MAGKLFADYAEQMMDIKRKAQDTIDELQVIPRGSW